MEIVSIIIKGEFSSGLDLDIIYQKIKDSGLLLSKKPWMRIKLQPGNFHLFLSKSGKFMVSKIKSVESLQKIKYKIIHFLKNLGIFVKIKIVKIANIVFLEKIELLQSIESIYLKLRSSNVSYEPEQFPALIYKDWGVCFLLFSTGKIIITGVKEVTLGDVVLKKFLDKII